MVPVDADREVQECESREYAGDDERGLQEAVIHVQLGEVAEPGEKSGAQEHEKNHQVPQDGNEIEAIAGAGIGHGFFVFFG